MSHLVALALAAFKLRYSFIMTLQENQRYLCRLEIEGSDSVDLPATRRNDGSVLCSSHQVQSRLQQIRE